MEKQEEILLEPRNSHLGSVIRIQGPLDRRTSDGFSEKVLFLARGGQIALDCKRMNHIDQSGLNEILKVVMHIQPKKVLLLNVDPANRPKFQRIYSDVLNLEITYADEPSTQM